MSQSVFMEDVRKICEADPRYDAAAYYFIREALDYTVKTLNKPPEGAGRHVSGKELLEGARRYALKEYGPMAMTVLGAWGVKRTEDIGEVVFNLVESKRLGKTESDSREDFRGGYDFYEAFRKPFAPASGAGGTKPRAGADRRTPAPGKGRRAS